MKKGAIFDLDGTMVDTIHLHNKAWEKLFLNYNIELTKTEIIEHSGKIGLSFVKLILKRRNIDTLNPQQLAREAEEIALDMLSSQNSIVFPHILELLQLLKKNQITLALATSASKKMSFFLAKDVLSYFDIKIFADDVKNGKPNPEIFLLAAKHMDLKISECVVFEDSESGVKAAKDGGFMCIAKDNNQGSNLSKADLIIQQYDIISLKEVFGII